jgi:hypothetical protein
MVVIVFISGEAMYFGHLGVGIIFGKKLTEYSDFLKIYYHIVARVLLIKLCPIF